MPEGSTASSGGQRIAFYALMTAMWLCLVGFALLQVSGGSGYLSFGLAALASIFFAVSVPLASKSETTSLLEF